MGSNHHPNTYIMVLNRASMNESFGFSIRAFGSVPWCKHVVFEKDHGRAAGLGEFDEIVRINGQSAYEMSDEEFIRMIRESTRINLFMKKTAEDRKGRYETIRNAAIRNGTT